MKEKETPKIIQDIIEKVKNSSLRTVEYARKNKKHRKIYYNAFAHCKEGYQSPLIYSIVSQISRSISIPTFTVATLSKNPTPEDKTIRNKIEALINYLVGIFDYEQAHRKGREMSVAFGDVYRRPTLAERVGKNNKRIYMPSYEILDADKLYFDDSARSLHDENFANEAKWFAYVEIYKKEDILARWGKDFLELVKPGLEIADYVTDYAYSEPNEALYEVVEYQNKATQQHLLLVGKNRLPVRWYGQSDEKPHIPKKFRDIIQYEDNYLYYNGQGVPILMLFNFNQYYNTNGIRNYGVCDLLEKVQNIHGNMVEALVRSTEREIRAIPYIYGSLVSNDLKDKMEAVIKDQNEKGGNSAALLMLPANNMSNNNVLQTGLIKFGSIDLNNVQAIIGLTNSLARHATGISPDQGEVRSNSVGQESILEEQKTLSIEAVIQNNLINIKRELEGLIAFVSAHKIPLYDKINITYDMVGDNLMDEILAGKTMGQVEPKVVTKQVNMTLNECISSIDGYDMVIEIDKDSMITKNLISHSENIVKMLGVMNPAHVPGAYKKAFMGLANAYGLSIDEQDLEGIENMQKAMGGSSQFQEDPEAAAGIHRGPGRPEEYNDAESLSQF